MVLAVETPADPSDPNSEPETKLFVDKPPVSSTRMESGTRYEFEDGSIMDVLDDGRVTVTSPDGSTTQEFGEPPIGSITFPSDQPDGGTTYSFTDPAVNLAIAQDPTSSVEDLDQLVNLGLHLDETGAPLEDTLNALFDHENLSPDTLAEILKDDGTDEVYLKHLEDDPALDYESGDLWSETDDGAGEPTDLGEAIVQAGGVGEAKRLGLIDEQNGELTDRGANYLDLLDTYGDGQSLTEVFRAAVNGDLYNPDGSVNQAVAQGIRVDRDHGQITVGDFTLDVEFMDSQGGQETEIDVDTEVDLLFQ
jgi:hypothetical protein